MLYTISAPHFEVGIVTQQKFVVRAPPIVRYMMGWSLLKVVEYCDKKGWLCVQL